MKSKKNIIFVCVVFGVFLAGVLFASSYGDGETVYEIHPEITVPEYKTDATRAIEAYERVMDRYMRMTEMNLGRMGAEMQNISRRLDSIDSKMSELSIRLARIEDSLGISGAKEPAEKQDSLEQSKSSSGCVLKKLK